MTDMKNFEIAAAEVLEADEVQEGITFKIGGEEVHAYEPTAGQMAMLSVRVSKFSSDRDMMSGTIDFFLGLFDKDSQAYIAQRLLDRNDQFELENVMEIMSWLMEEFTGRPLDKSSSSATSPPKSGAKLTATAPGKTSTPSRSRRAVTST